MLKVNVRVEHLTVFLPYRSLVTFTRASDPSELKCSFLGGTEPMFPTWRLRVLTFSTLLSRRVVSYGLGDAPRTRRAAPGSMATGGGPRCRCRSGSDHGCGDFCRTHSRTRYVPFVRYWGNRLGPCVGVWSVFYFFGARFHCVRRFLLTVSKRRGRITEM